jgi:hypothetical protein
MTARAVAQEHSYVPDMWQRLSRGPKVLIYLQVAPRRLATPRPVLHRRLSRRAGPPPGSRPAPRASGDLYRRTDEEGVLARALAGLATAGVAAADLAVPGDEVGFITVCLFFMDPAGDI